MSDRTKEIWKLVGYLIFVFVIISFAVYQIVTTDKDLVDNDKREMIHGMFEDELKNIQIPEKFTIKNFEKNGKSGFSLRDSITYRTRLSRTDTINQTDQELKRFGWTFWKKDKNNIFVYCKGKFNGEAVYTRYEPENSTDIFLTLSLESGSGVSFGEVRPKECEN